MRPEKSVQFKLKKCERGNVPGRRVPRGLPALWRRSSCAGSLSIRLVMPLSASSNAQRSSHYSAYSGTVSNSVGDLLMAKASCKVRPEKSAQFKQCVVPGRGLPCTARPARPLASQQLHRVCVDPPGYAP
jgi:hypothetical protein